MLGFVVKVLNTFPRYIKLTGLLIGFGSTLSATDCALPALHCISIAMPPLTLAPFTAPDGHCFGSAGSNVMTNGVCKVGTSGACNKAFCISSKF
jgi:hypothetical protein